MNDPSSGAANGAIGEAPEGFGHRIQRLIAELGISQNEFARQVGSTPAVVSNIANGKSKPGLDFIERVADKFEFSLEWLIRGRGGMYGTPSYDKDWFDVLTLRAALVSIASRGDHEAELLLAELVGDTPHCATVTEQRQELLDQVSKVSTFPGFVGEIYKKFPRRPSDSAELAQITREIRRAADNDVLSTMVKVRL